MKSSDTALNFSKKKSHGLELVFNAHCLIRKISVSLASSFSVERNYLVLESEIT